jgi:hypothetical protein
VLERLVDIAFRTIRVEDDTRHDDGQVYSPDARDAAQNAGQRFRWLLPRASREAPRLTVLLRITIGQLESTIASSYEKCMDRFIGPGTTGNLTTTKKSWGITYFALEDWLPLVQVPSSMSICRSPR